MSPKNKREEIGVPEARTPADARKRILRSGSRIAAPASYPAAEVANALAASEANQSDLESSKEEEDEASEDSSSAKPEKQAVEEADQQAITISKNPRRPKATVVQVPGSVPFQVVLAKQTKPGTRRNPRQLKLSPERKTVVTTIHFDEAVLACLSSAASTAKVRISHLVHQACIEWIKRVKLPMPEVAEASEEKETG